MAPAKDKLQRLWADMADDVVEATCDTSEGFCPSFTRLSQKLKRLKFFFIDAETQTQFAAFASGGRRLTEELPNSEAGDSQRKAAKEKNKAVKQRIALELQLRDQLVKEVAEANRKMAGLYEQCQQDLKDAEEAEVSSQVVLDLQLGADKIVETLNKNDQGTVHGTREVRQLWMARDDMAVKRRRLDEEIRSSEAQRRQNEQRSAALARTEKHELDLIQSYEQLCEAEEKLGLPKLEIDHARGVALLGQPAGPDQEVCGAEAELLRTIQVEFDKDGALCKAEPHPALGLQQAASKALARQDFGLLTTLAWARLNESDFASVG